VVICRAACAQRTPVHADRWLCPPPPFDDESTAPPTRAVSAVRSTMEQVFSGVIIGDAKGSKVLPLSNIQSSCPQHALKPTSPPSLKAFCTGLDRPQLASAQRSCFRMLRVRSTTRPSAHRIVPGGQKIRTRWARPPQAYAIPMTEPESDNADSLLGSPACRDAWKRLNQGPRFPSRALLTAAATSPGRYASAEYVPIERRVGPPSLSFERMLSGIK
jgi:hypothetical protein